MSLLLKRSRALLLLSLCGVLVLLFATCQTQKSSGPVENAPQETVVSTTPPFQTKEPDRYRATRTITIVNSAGETVLTTMSIARDGEKRRHESNNVAYLDVPEGRFVLLPAEKVYADIASESELPPSDGAEQLEISPDRLLHTETGTTNYQRVGPEAIEGRNTNKYRITVNGATPGNVSVNETLVWVDDQLNMPIRSETKSADGTRITTELSDVTLDVDGRLFQIPEGYKKVEFSELRKRLTNSQPRE